MTKIEAILQEIDELKPEDQKALLENLLMKIRKMNSLFSIVEKYKGKGKGIWQIDAQDYVNEIRNEER